MEKLEISIGSVWEKLLRIRVSTSMLSDILKDMEKEMDALKRTVYELRQIEEKNVNSKG